MAIFSLRQKQRAISTFLLQKSFRSDILTDIAIVHTENGTLSLWFFSSPARTLSLLHWASVIKISIQPREIPKWYLTGAFGASTFFWHTVLHIQKLSHRLGRENNPGVRLSWPRDSWGRVYRGCGGLSKASGEGPKSIRFIYNVTWRKKKLKGTGTLFLSPASFGGVQT